MAIYDDQYQVAKFSTYMTTFYIVRHGETEWNVKGFTHGHKDSPLTRKGISQAHQLAREFRHIHFDKIFSSDLFRAKHTAEIIGLEKQMIIQTTEALREQTFGKYDGMRREELSKLFTQWREMSEKKRHHYKLVDEMESNAETVSRLILFMKEISVAFPKETILLVCHNAIMRYFYIHLGQGTYDTFFGFTNLGFMKVESDGIDFFLKEIKGAKKKF